MGAEMNFDLEKCRVRLAKTTDKDDLIRVAKGIWGGTDYLPRVLDAWLQEPWFWVCEYEGRVIACLKMTAFPDNVLWFEGLRVMARYQNHGIAKLMNRKAFELAERLSAENPGLKYEFCTYYLNSESLHITQKMGFKVVKKFFDLQKRGVKATLKPKLLQDYDLSIFHHYPDYIPCAWRTVHNTPLSLPFLRQHGQVFETPNARYYLGGLHEPSILLLEPPQASIAIDLPYFQHFFGPRKSYGLILPTKFKRYLPVLHKAGFRFWEKEQIENMLLLSK